MSTYRGLLLLALLALTGANAQPVTPVEEPAPDTGAAVDSAADKAVPGEPEAPGDERSPFDYEPSEQISEDLSVSFPVDI
jgi:hypothetical protein